METIKHKITVVLIFIAASICGLLFLFLSTSLIPIFMEFAKMLVAGIPENQQIGSFVMKLGYLGAIAYGVSFLFRSMDNWLLENIFQSNQQQTKREIEKQDKAYRKYIRSKIRNKSGVTS